jgi:hypothetical protein
MCVCVYACVCMETVLDVPNRYVCMCVCVYGVCVCMYGNRPRCAIQVSVCVYVYVCMETVLDVPYR